MADEKDQSGQLDEPEVEYVNATDRPIPVYSEDDDAVNSLVMLDPGETVSLQPFRRTAGLSPVDKVDLDAQAEAVEAISGPGDAALEPQEALSPEEADAAREKEAEKATKSTKSKAKK